MDVITQVLQFVLSKADSLPAEKIAAFAQVIAALKGHNFIPPSPNQVPAEPNDFMLNDDEPIDLSEISGVVVDGVSNKGVKIFKERTAEVEPVAEPQPQKS